jgi:hypothetical protein
MRTQCTGDPAADCKRIKIKWDTSQGIQGLKLEGVNFFALCLDIVIGQARNCQLQDMVKLKLGTHQDRGTDRLVGPLAISFCINLARANSTQVPQIVNIAVAKLKVIKKEWKLSWIANGRDRLLAWLWIILRVPLDGGVNPME